MPVDLRAHTCIIASMECSGRFLRRQRLSLKKDYDRVFAEGKSAADGSIVVYVLTTHLGYPRLGMAVGKRVGNATARNRLKRLIREAFRLNRDRLPESADIVVIARQGAGASLDGIARSLVRLAGKMKREKD